MNGEQKKRLMRAAAVLLGAGLLAAFIVCVLRPPCPILKLTGFACAGCGGQRMLLDLFRGDFAGAFRHNPFLFCLLPAAAVYCLWGAARYVKEKPPLYKSRGFPAAAAVVAVLAVVFMVLRNLPGLAFLGPD